MILYDKIRLIQSEYGIGAVEFIEKSGFSNGMYYDIKSGKKKSLSPVQIKKLKDIFPEFDFSLFNIKNKIKKNLSKAVLDSIRNIETLEDVSNFIVDYEDELKNIEVFKLWLKTKVQEGVIKVLSSDLK